MKIWERKPRRNVRLSIYKRVKERIRKAWKKTLIIKLLGRNIGYTLLNRKIHDLWRPKATIHLVAIENGYFLARFSFLEEYEYACSI